MQVTIVTIKRFQFADCKFDRNSTDTTHRITEMHPSLKPLHQISFVSIFSFLYRNRKQVKSE